MSDQGTQTPNFTPGPWTIAPCSDTDETRDIVSEYEQHADGIKQANWIAELDAQIDSDSDAEAQMATLDANAHLIAAAPDLYAALKALADDYDQLLGDGVTESNQPDILRQARLALAKADGTSQ